MSKPLIGATCYARDEENNFSIPAGYLDAIERAHGIPVVITPGTKPEELVEKLDGFMLTGGGDVDPAEYSGKFDETIYGVNYERDQFELELARTVVYRGAPLLAICRGLQVLNVALGGTLIEDIPKMVGTRVSHRDKFSRVAHWVEIAPNSMLSQICGLTKLICPSFHHQSVRDLAQDFEAVAWSADGVIEAMESSKYPGVMAVQWHPEYVANADESQQRLFDTLVDWSKNGIPNRHSASAAVERQLKSA